MRRTKADPVLLLTPGEDEIAMFCNALNTEFVSFPVPTERGWQRVQTDCRTVQRELHRLVRNWFESGLNVKKLFEADPLLARASMRFPAQMIPTQTGQARLIYMTAPESMKPGDPLEIALGLFLSFLLNPANSKLAGPCRQCGKYYLKKTKRQVVYCSDICGRKIGSTLRTERPVI